MSISVTPDLLPEVEAFLGQGPLPGWIGGQRAESSQFQEIRGVFQDFRNREGEPQQVAEALVVALEDLPYVADAMTVSELTSGPAADSFAVLMRNSYHPSRWIGGVGSQGSGVVFRWAEGLYPSTSRRGTGHGTPYYYDRHVPLIFYGSGVDAGTSTESVRTVDIAPTLAWLAGVAAPTDLDGRPLFN